LAACGRLAKKGEEGSKRIVAFLGGVVLMLLCGALVWLLILRLHQSFGDFLRGSDAALMQVEIIVIGALAWREARRMRSQQQKKQ
jgi:biotin transporter BioY